MVYKNAKMYDNGYLDVGDGHSIYYELCGNQKGKPVLFVHGGPGGGIRKKQRRFFNPKKFNIIMFDQRGSGKSKPFASIKNNTTFELVSDMRKLLGHLGIKKVILFGGSWGSTLSLVYAIRHPETVSGMVISGIFLPSKSDIDYFVNNAGDRVPEEWNRLISQVPLKNRGDIIGYYYKMMQSKNKKLRKRFVKEWARYELSIASLKPSEKKIMKAMKEIKIEAFSLIEMHYLKNNCFMPKDFILKNVNKLKMPVIMIHGRYDNVCSPVSAYVLHKKLKNSKLYFTIAGHSASDKENEERLVSEMNKMAQQTFLLFFM